MVQDTKLELELGISSYNNIISHTSSGERCLLSPVEPSLNLSLSSPAAPGVSSPRSTVTSLSVSNYRPSVALKGEKVDGGEEAEVERATPSQVISEDDDDGGARKKLRLTKEQSALLEDRFKEHSTLSPKQKQALAKQLNLRPRQVEVWFQNRRARTKLKQTEIDCEFLKRCCESLTEENRHLQKELQQLKSLKFSPATAALYMQLPAATLTVCPSCERIAASTAAGDSPKVGSGTFLAAPTKAHSFLNPCFSPSHPSAACLLEKRSKEENKPKGSFFILGHGS